MRDYVMVAMAPYSHIVRTTKELPPIPTSLITCITQGNIWYIHSHRSGTALTYTHTHTHTHRTHHTRTHILSLSLSLTHAHTHNCIHPPTHIYYNSHSGLDKKTTAIYTHTHTHTHTHT